MIHSPWLSHVLDGAILLAVLTQAVSLGDFILLPKQKKALEAWCEDITLKLDVINTAGFLQRWLRASRRAQIGHVLFVIISVIAVVAPAVVVGMLVFSFGFSWFGVGLVFLTLVLQGWCWNQSTKVYESLGTQVFQTLKETENVGQFLIVYLVMALAGLVAIVGIAALFGWVSGFIPYASFWHWVLRFVGNFYAGLIVTWLILFLDGIITLTVATLIWPFRFLVVVARWFMWRVSSYPKGPLAALIAVVGAVLAVIRFSVKE